MCSGLICLGLLRVATVGIRNFPVSTEFAEFCALAFVACLVVRPLVLPIFLDCLTESRSNFIHLILCDWPLTGTSHVTNRTRRIERLTPLGDGRFHSRFHTRVRAKSFLHCNRRCRFVIPEHTLLASCTWDSILTSATCRQWWQTGEHGLLDFKIRSY